MLINLNFLIEFKAKLFILNFYRISVFTTVTEDQKNYKHRLQKWRKWN